MTAFTQLPESTRNTATGPHTIKVPNMGISATMKVAQAQIADNGTPSLSATNTFTVTVSEVNSAPVHARHEIEGVIAAQARNPGCGLLVMPDIFNRRNRDLIIALAARYGVPAIYYNRFFSEPGGLISYGELRVETFRLAAGYIDRILKGEKPADLPVQAPTKFELIINLKTAKALGLTIPETLLATADEVIQ